MLANRMLKCHKWDIPEINGWIVKTCNVMAIMMCVWSLICLMPLQYCEPQVKWIFPLRPSVLLYSFVNIQSPVKLWWNLKFTLLRSSCYPQNNLTLSYVIDYSIRFMPMGIWECIKIDWPTFCWTMTPSRIAWPNVQWEPPKE